MTIKNVKAITIGSPSQFNCDCIQKTAIRSQSLRCACAVFWHLISVKWHDTKTARQKMPWPFAGTLRALLRYKLKHVCSSLSIWMMKPHTPDQQHKSLVKPVKILANIGYWMNSVFSYRLLLSLSFCRMFIASSWAWTKFIVFVLCFLQLTMKSNYAIV